MSTVKNQFNHIIYHSIYKYPYLRSQTILSTFE